MPSAHTGRQDQWGCVPALGVVVMAKYMALLNLTSEAIRRFLANPSDRAAVVRGLVESVGGNLECYYWVFGQYDGMAVFEMPDAHTSAATSRAIVRSAAFPYRRTLSGTDM